MLVLNKTYLTSNISTSFDIIHAIYLQFTSQLRYFRALQLNYPAHVFIYRTINTKLAISIEINSMQLINTHFILESFQSALTLFVYILPHFHSKKYFNFDYMYLLFKFISSAHEKHISWVTH